MLANIAINDRKNTVRRAALEKLTDPALLAEVAKNSNAALTRDAAAKKLADLQGRRE